LASFPVISAVDWRVARANKGRVVFRPPPGDIRANTLAAVGFLLLTVPAWLLLAAGSGADPYWMLCALALLALGTGFGTLRALAALRRRLVIERGADASLLVRVAHTLRTDRYFLRLGARPGVMTRRTAVLGSIHFGGPDHGGRHTWRAGFCATADQPHATTPALELELARTPVRGETPPSAPVGFRDTVEVLCRGLGLNRVLADPQPQAAGENATLPAPGGAATAREATDALRRALLEGPQELPAAVHEQLRRAMDLLESQKGAELEAGPMLWQPPGKGPVHGPASDLPPGLRRLHNQARRMKARLHGLN
jgi:hypothetical protein